MSDSNHDLWGSFIGVPRACDEVRGHKKNSRCNVNMWCLNSGVKDEMKHI